MGFIRYYVLIILFAPLLWGAVYSWTISIWLLAFAALAACVPDEWFRGPKFTTFSFYGIVCAFIIVVILQVLPSPLSLAPNSIWGLSTNVLGGNIPARVASDLSSLIWELGTVALYALAFWTALAVGSDYHRATTFLRWAVGGTTILVGLTLILYFTDERFLLWYRRDYYLGDFTHGFINRNSAASFLGTFLIVSIGLLVHSIRNLNFSAKQFSPDIFDKSMSDLLKHAAPHAIAVALFTGGLFLTGSRAGILLTGVSIVFLMILVMIKSNVRSSFKIINFAIVACLLFWALSNWGDKISGRIEALGFTLIGRAEVYSATLDMINDYPLLGVGLGGFTNAFPVYRPITFLPNGFWDKAHNTYLEVTAEMGLPFAILLAVFWIGLFVILMRGFITRKQRYILPAIGAATWLLASLHSFVDFSLQIPGHAIVVAAILGVCIAQTVRFKRS